MFEDLSRQTRQIVEKLAKGVDMPVLWEWTKDPVHGDATTTVALRLAHQLQKKPRDIAAPITEALKDLPSIERVEVAGAGYINVWLQPDVLINELARTRAAVMPVPVRKSEAPVIIEGSDPNIAKPLGIHHILPTVIGQSLVNLYRHAGYPVISWNYIGDWGTQFGTLAVAMERWGSGKPTKQHSLDELLRLYVRFHEEAEADPDLVPQARGAFRRMEQGDAHLLQFWEEVVDITKAALVPLYERLHVSFDLESGESFYNDKMGPILEEGKKKGVFVTGNDGALIVRFPEETGWTPYLVQKGDGATLYSTRDLAQMRYRIDTFHPQTILIPTDISQKLHFEQLMATCRMMGWELPEFENVLFGRMRFADKKMSTRKGNILKLEEVLDEGARRAAVIIQERGEAIQTDDPEDLAEMMGVGALAYGILSQNRKMDIVFDWEKMLSFEGNSAPYIQYTHARARSVLRKGNVTMVEPPAGVSQCSPHDRRLLLTLLRFPAVLAEARAERLPHKLANFLYDLCQTFNGFYNAEPILQAPDAQTKQLRLSLTSLTADVLKAGASILTIRVPDRM